MLGGGGLGKCPGLFLCPSILGPRGERYPPPGVTPVPHRKQARSLRTTSKGFRGPAFADQHAEGSRPTKPGCVGVFISHLFRSPQFPDKTPQQRSSRASAGLRVIVFSFGQGSWGVFLQAAGPIVSKEEGRMPAGGGRGGKGREREREASTEARGQLIPSHWGFSPHPFCLCS